MATWITSERCTCTQHKGVCVITVFTQVLSYLYLFILRAALLGLPAPKYFVPPCLVGPLEAAFAAFRAMDGSDLPCSIHSMVPGDRVILHGKAGSTLVPTDVDAAAAAEGQSVSLLPVLKETHTFAPNLFASPSTLVLADVDAAAAGAGQSAPLLPVLETHTFAPNLFASPLLVLHRTDATKPMKFVTCWATTHRVPSQGYIVWQTHIRLREQFRAAGADIPALRKTMPHFGAPFACIVYYAPVLASNYVFHSGRTV